MSPLSPAARESQPGQVRSGRPRRRYPADSPPRRGCFPVKTVPATPALRANRVKPSPPAESSRRTRPAEPPYGSRAPTAPGRQEPDPISALGGAGRSTRSPDLLRFRFARPRSRIQVVLIHNDNRQERAAERLDGSQRRQDEKMTGETSPSLALHRLSVPKRSFFVALPEVRQND